MNRVILKTEFSDISLVKRGKVRDVYEISNHLLIVATDRISAFDVVLPNGIPEKGRMLTQMSLYWFKQMQEIIPNHIVNTKVEDFPQELRKYHNILDGRTMFVKKTNPLPVECVVRGYLAGSGWKEYKEKGMLCGIQLPKGLVESSRLDEPIFTPSTKEEQGHDINISYEVLQDIIGDNLAQKLKDISIAVYSKARDIAEGKGIIIADTKFEFGHYLDDVILIDELLTPDSSRFWSKKDYAPGRSQDSYDKQIVRDYLLTLKWDKTYPSPSLPEEIIRKTANRYREILKIITGEE